MLWSTDPLVDKETALNLHHRKLDTVTLAFRKQSCRSLGRSLRKSRKGLPYHIVALVSLLRSRCDEEGLADYMDTCFF